MDPNDPLETCPYDEVHRIMRSCMQRHLIKCRKNFPCKEMKICVYNATHVIRDVEYEYHLEHCEDAREIISYTHITEDAKTCEQVTIDEIQSQWIPASSENWDDEPFVESYNPLEHVENKAILRTLSCAPKSEKKKFRQMERMRHQELESKTVKVQDKKVHQEPHKSKGKTDTPESVQAKFSTLYLSDLTNTAACPAKENGKTNEAVDPKPNLSKTAGNAVSSKPTLPKTNQNAVSPKPTLSKTGENAVAPKPNLPKADSNAKPGPSNAVQPAVPRNAMGRGKRLMSSLFNVDYDQDAKPFSSKPGSKP